jgi:hypothetical protein
MVFSVRVCGSFQERFEAQGVRDDRAMARRRTGARAMSDKAPVCRGDHSGHICVLASAGKFDEIKELTRSPKYICFNCGRVADCDGNLCNPMPLE